MQTKLKIIGIFIFLIFGFSSQVFGVSNQCDTPYIANLFTDFETNYSKDFNKELFKESISLAINIFFKELTETENIDDAKNFFKERQDEKFKLALEYYYENFEVEGREFDQKKGGPGSDARKKLDELGTIDFFTRNDMKKPETGFIPVKTLFRSILLDGMIYSCYLSSQIGVVNFEKERDISLILKLERNSSAVINEEIKRQKEVAKYVILKYQSFLDNYLIHKQLESIVFYLDKLRTRMADLASIIGFLPAKIVNFGFH